MHSTYVGLVPARGGSRRLPGKNLRELRGRPLIEWTIRAALGSRLERVIVSTDAEPVGVVARSAGAEVPFVRPAALASDVATTTDVVLHALKFLRAGSDSSTHVVVLQPTSPLRTSEDIDGALTLRERHEADAVISVCRAECPAAWINTLPPDGRMTDFFRDGIRRARSQDLEIGHRLNGAIYVYDIERVLRQRSLEMDDSSYAYMMPRERSIDIDDETDFLFAEALADRLAL